MGKYKNKLKKINDKHMSIFGILLIILALVNIILCKNSGNTIGMIFYILMLLVTFIFLIIYLNRYSLKKENTASLDKPVSKETTSTLDNNILYTQINAVEAKDIMDSNNNCIILDVRAMVDYEKEHIENAICIPSENILNGDFSKLTDKMAKILIYCYDGELSNSVAQYLANQGYTDIYEFGGIIDWGYEMVSE